MVYPILAKAGSRSILAYNLHANVGVGSPNRLADVQFCQLGFVLRSADPKVDPALRVLFRKVPFGPNCSGRPDDPLCAAILAWQNDRAGKNVGATQDGHISKFAGDTFRYVAGNESRLYLLELINVAIQDGLGDRWPRVDLMDGCPDALQDEVNGFFNWG
jgi:hypothetical protein